jgi:hypothetical protein
VKDLSKAIKFRKRCRESDRFFKQSTFEENLSWKDKGEDACGSTSNENVRVKEEDQKIKDEPTDDFDLFENIDTILEENPEGSDEKNLAGMLNSKAEHTSDSSDSESELEEEIRERKRRRIMRRAAEFKDFDLK